jgi:hypothetical protein
MKKLSNDVSRCHDSTCPYRLECARFLQRHTSHGGGPVVSTYSLWTTGTDECRAFIAQEGEKLDA